MTLEELRQYNTISVQSWCCTELPRVTKILPDLFPEHNFCHIKNPIRRIEFKGKVQMGKVEDLLRKTISTISDGIENNKKYCVNFVPLFNILWIEAFRMVSPYLKDEAIGLFQKIDLLVLPTRIEIPGRIGGHSWFVDSSIAKNLEENISSNLADLVYNSNIKYISLNKLLEIARDKGLWK